MLGEDFKDLACSNFIVVFKCVLGGGCSIGCCVHGVLGVVM